VSDDVALVGYGRMGRPMGRRLVAAGKRLVVYDVDPAVGEAAESDGARLASSPAHAAEGADVVLTMLPDPAATAAAARGEAGILAGLAPGTLWLEMGSSHPATTRELAQAAAERRASLLDAPVSGGVAGAEQGTLTIMVGGPAALLERARPILETLGRNIFHVGDQPGDGDLAKTINNLLSAVNLTAAAEAMALGMRGGLDPARLLEAVGAGTGSSRALTEKIPGHVLSGRFAAGFTIGQMLKDLGIGQDVAEDLGVPTPIGSLVHGLWAAFADQGHAEADHTEVAAMVAARAGVELAPRP
jgi:3-hydroxyisobutyrate dehydrogenase-like beta-hydroxyacid dehydrogenase